MALLTFTDEKEQATTTSFASAASSGEPVLRSGPVDFSFLKQYLHGKTIEELASMRFMTRAKVSSDINRLLLLLRTKLYPQIPDEFIDNPFSYRVLWLNVIEDFQIYQLTEDPSNIEQVYFSHYLGLRREEQMAIVDELRQYL